MQPVPEHRSSVSGAGRRAEPISEVEQEDVGPRDAFARCQATSRRFFISVRALSFPIELFSICRMRSRVTLKIAPISSNVAGSRPSSPYRSSSTRRSRKVRVARDSVSARKRELSSATSSGNGALSARKCPNSGSLVADRLLERTGVCALRRICSTSSSGRSTSRATRRVRLATELAAQLALRAHDLVQLLDDVHRHPDRPRLVGERTRDGLPDPPRRIGRELEALAVVELLRGAHKADRPLLDQVEERQPLVAVPLGDRDDKAEVRLDHLLLRAVVTPLDAFRRLDLLRRRQQVDLADVLQERLKRILRWRSAWCRQ